MTDRQPSVAVTQRRYALLDLLQQHPEGLTKAQLGTMLGTDADIISDDIRQLRRDPDVINIPCKPNGWNEPWLYYLTNEAEPNRFWAHNRIGDQESRFKTEVGMAATLVRVTNGRTLDGRKARKIHRVLSYLMAELAELERETELVV